MGVTNSSGKGSAPMVMGRSSLQRPAQQPQYGMPNQYANTVGGGWDNASLYPRQTSQPVGMGKGYAPSGVGAPAQSKGKGLSGFAQSAANQQAAQQPVQSVQNSIKAPVTPLQNTQANSAAALYASRGTPGDVEGLQYWQGRYAAGEDPAQVQKDFNASYDYVKARQPVTAGVQSPLPPVMPTAPVAPTTQSQLTPEQELLQRQQDARLWDTQYG